MWQCRPFGWVARPVRPWLNRRVYSEYAPAPPAPSDLKAPLPEKYSVGKNLKLKAVLFEYDVLASSSSNGVHASAAPKATSNNQPVETTTNTPGFQPLSPSGENLVNEITGLLGKARGAARLEGNSLQDMGRTLIADLKKKMGSGGAGEALPKKPAAKQEPTRHPQDSDPAAKYMDKLRLKTGGRRTTTSTAATQPAGDADLLFVAKERVSAAESANRSAWMLKQGAGDLLLYLAARGVRLGLIASPRTSQGEFERFVAQLRQQSVLVRAAISPAAMELDGVEPSVARAGGELGVDVGSEVLVVGSSDPILRASTAAQMFTARYHPPNTRREGVIQTFVVRDIDEVRTVVEEVNGVSFR